MLRNRTGIGWIPVIAVLMVIPVGRANIVVWIPGQTCPPAWSVAPARPCDTDTIQFSGPVRFYVSRCVAEKSLGGRPVLTINPSERTVELRFEQPPSNDCTGFWSPVCGLKGDFGPLGPGRWRFFSKANQVVFSVEFTVAGEAGIQTLCYVDPSAPGARNGTSWRNAFNTLQEAMAPAGEGAEIRVAQGTYRPDCDPGFPRWDRHATFRLKPGVVVKGGYAGWRSVTPDARDILAYETILTGDLKGDDRALSRPVEMVDDFNRTDNSYHVVTMSGTDAAATLDGFTITGGMAADSELPDDLNGGGGIYNDGGSATIRNCLIVGNGADHYGAGFYSRNECTPVLIDCTVANNWTRWAGGGIYYHWGTDLIVTRCVVTGNGATFQGGGICSHDGGRLLLSNSVVSGNRVTDSTWSRGGGLYGSRAEVYINQCTFIGNMAAAGTALACDLFAVSDPSEIRVSNCILWGDGRLIDSEGQAVVEITHSSVRGSWPGHGNIDADPCLVQMGSWDDAGTAYDPCDDSWSEGDYHLQWTSPCMDTAGLEAVWEPNGTDLDERPRVSGLGVDMGAYELRNDPPVADAGSDVTGFALAADAKGSVTLDGGKSRDPEGLALQYRWYHNDQIVSEKARFTTEMPVGSHTYTLVVGDPTGQVGSDEAIATVMLVIGTKTFVSPQKMKRNGGKDILAMTVLPKGKFPKDFDSSEPMRLFPGGIAAVKQSAFVWLSGDALVQSTFKRADVMAAVPANGRTELRLVGRLKNGQYFSAADFVIIE